MHGREIGIRTRERKRRYRWEKRKISEDKDILQASWNTNEGSGDG